MNDDSVKNLVLRFAEANRCFLNGRAQVLKNQSSGIIIQQLHNYRPPFSRYRTFFIITTILTIAEVTFSYDEGLNDNRHTDSQIIGASTTRAAILIYRLIIFETHGGYLLSYLKECCLVSLVTFCEPYLALISSRLFSAL